MPRTQVRLTGYDEALRKAKKIEDLYPLVLAKALHMEGRRILNLSKERVPVRTGALKASAYINQPVFAGPVMSVELGYGGTEKVPYASYIHEHPRAGETEGLRPGARGLKGQGYSSWAGVGQWKYLDSVVNEEFPSIKERVAENTRRVMKSLVK